MTTAERDVNSADEIIIERSDLDEVVHAVEQHSEVLFSWDYERSRAALVKLYEKAKTSQWNVTTDLDWDTEVDNEKLAVEFVGSMNRFAMLDGEDDSPVASWGPTEWSAFAHEMQKWTLSQFLHGEQGALICTGLITTTVPWIDAKYYAATQVMDEARHVATWRRRWAAATRSIHSSAGFLTTSSRTATGTSPISACRSWSRGWHLRRSGSCT